MRAKPLVQVKDIVKKFHSPEGETIALNNLSLDVFEGDFVSVVGPSGCGKSTLLNIMAGLMKPTEGEVRINDKPVKAVTTSVGYMPQTDQLFEWRTIWKNVILGLEVQNKLSPDAEEKVQNLLDRYGLWEFRNAYPRHLSGGMRQRAALIRTLAINPEILLLDEAFSALDYQTRLVVSDEVKTIILKEGKTAILVTHDIGEAISMSNRVVVLSGRPGTVKNTHIVELTCTEPTPLKCREAPEFRDYFNRIWKELDIHVQ
jgi:NitT/TauT family transport system ATP-binding protein